MEDTGDMEDAGDMVDAEDVEDSVDVEDTDMENMDTENSEDTEDVEDVGLTGGGEHMVDVGVMRGGTEVKTVMENCSIGRMVALGTLHIGLDEMRSDGMLCDGVLLVEESNFNIHRNILAAISPYFSAMFTRWHSDERKYTITGVSPDIMELFINYIYDKKIRVTFTEVTFLLVMSNYMFIQELTHDCNAFLKNRVNCANCLKILKFPDIYAYQTLRKKAYWYALNHFEACVRSPSNGLFELTMEELSDILKKDELNIRHEITAFEAVLKWITHEPSDRMQHITTLLPKVRLALLSPKYLIDNLKANLPLSCPSECQPIVVNTLKAMYNVTFGGPQTRLLNPLTRPRIPDSILFAIGGFADTSPTNIIETYDSRLDNWMVTSTKEPKARAYHGTVFLESCVYVIGGFDIMEYYNTTIRFNPTTGTWMELSPMHVRRCYISLAVFEGFIYAMGGFDGVERLNTAECYNSGTNQWSLIPPMHDHRSDASAAVLNSKVYICGGFNGNECLFSAECFDTHVNQWTLIEPMLMRRSGVGIITLNNQLFAIGGFDGSNRLESVEVYNPNADSWRFRTPMLNPRSNFGVEMMEGFLYVIGGYGGEGTTSSCERYNERTNQWVDIQNMNVSRSAVSCCVVSGLRNVRDYIIPREELN